MWKPVFDLSEMTRDERLAFLSFTSDDMKEQIVTYLLNLVEENKSAATEVDFFKGHNSALTAENARYKIKNKLLRYKNNRLQRQVQSLVEKLKLSS